MTSIRMKTCGPRVSIEPAGVTVFCRCNAETPSAHRTANDQEKGKHVHNLTTAACVWLTACAGAACGIGEWRLVLIGAMLALMILWTDAHRERSEYVVSFFRGCGTAEKHPRHEPPSRVSCSTTSPKRCNAGGLFLLNANRSSKRSNLAPAARGAAGSCVRGRPLALEGTRSAIPLETCANYSGYRLRTGCCAGSASGWHREPVPGRSVERFCRLKAQP
jgi:hypothetical protein